MNRLNRSPLVKAYEQAFQAAIVEARTHECGVHEAAVAQVEALGYAGCDDDAMELMEDQHDGMICVLETGDFWRVDDNDQIVHGKINIAELN